MYFVSQEYSQVIFSRNRISFSISQTSSVVSGIIKNWSGNNASIWGKKSFSFHERARIYEGASQDSVYKR